MEMTICRIYITEGDKRLEPIIDYLRKTAKVRGVTVFRAIEGFGESGKRYGTNFLDLVSDLPLVVEFFDETATMRTILNDLSKQIEAEHMVYWQAQTNE